MLKPFGMGISNGAAATAYPAYPPPGSKDVTLSPNETPETLGPSATTSPAISIPGKSDAPGGGG